MTDRSKWQLDRLTPEAILDSLIRALDAPLDGPAAFTAYVATQRSMGCSSIDGPHMQDGWIKSETERRAKRMAELIQWRNELRGLKVAALMADLGDEFHHFSIRSIDSRGIGPCTVEIYRKDSNGLNGFRPAGHAHDCPEVRAAVGARDSEYIGPRHGQMSRFDG